MQNRYVGDIGDYAKYALLRSISGSVRFGLVWCLFWDESHNTDGRHTSYLHRPEFRSLDPELYDRLALIVGSGRRSVRNISRAGLFPADTISFELPIALPKASQADPAARQAHRAKWISMALSATATCDLVFFDPDNGFEIPSVLKRGSKAGKYIYFDELDSFWERDQSLIIYHHLNRSSSVEEQTQALRRRILAKFSDAALVRCLLFRRGSCRHFWILAKATHAARLKSGLQMMLRSGWDRYFEVG
jgi:hypothetical protein